MPEDAALLGQQATLSTEGSERAADAFAQGGDDALAGFRSEVATVAGEGLGGDTESRGKESSER